MHELCGLGTRGLEGGVVRHRDTLQRRATHCNMCLIGLERESRKVEGRGKTHLPETHLPETREGAEKKIYRSVCQYFDQHCRYDAERTLPRAELWILRALMGCLFVLCSVLQHTVLDAFVGYLQVVLMSFFGPETPAK